MPKPKIDRKAWRDLPYEQWNTATIHAYFADMNRERYGAGTYLPMRNWGFEQGAIKRALAQYGAEVLREVFDECFRTYTPTPDYPILTAGFALAYRANGIIPKVLANRQRQERITSVEVNGGMSAEELANF